MPSPLTSATATESGCVPAAKVCCGWKVPSPLPSSTLTRYCCRDVGDDEVGLAVAVDVRHRHEYGQVPVAKFWRGWKVPLPLPSSTLT